MKLLWIIISVALLGFSSCRPTITCEDVPCAFGEFCNTITGECQRASRACVDDSSCSTGEFCDDETKECVASQLQCTDRFTCPLSQICNAQTGFCEPESQCSRDGCGPAETCNETTEQCEPTLCDDSSDCPVRFTCAESGVCSAGCTSEDDCPDDEFCTTLDGTVGVCEPSCRTDIDCPFGRFCDDALQPPLCAPEPPCIEDSDCRVDEVCLFGSCAQPPCQSDDDCFETQFCDNAIGTCIDIECEEDVYGRGDIGSPNNSFENAADIEVGDYRNLRLCRATEDWFKIRLRATDITTVTVRSETDDLDIVVLDDSRTVLARDERQGQVSVVQFNPAKTGPVFVSVTSQSRNVVEYDLEISTSFCANDLFEENDTASTAKVVPSQPDIPVALPLRSCPGDDDWFRITALSEDSGIRVTPTVATNALNIFVVDPNGETFTVPFDETFISPRVGVAGDYLVGVNSPVPVAYEIELERLSVFNCPESELHTTFDTAVGETATIGAHAFCPVVGGWETDWYKLPVLSGINRVRIIPNEATPTLDAVIFNGATAETLVRAAVQIDNEHSAVFENNGGDYWLRISSEASSDRIVGIPTYTIVLDTL